jgi:hypothetical protein
MVFAYYHVSEQIHEPSTRKFLLRFEGKLSGELTAHPANPPANPLRMT